MTDYKVCCLIGEKLQFSESSTECDEFLDALTSRLEYLIEKLEVNVFVSGMSEGFETLAAEQVLLLKRKYPHIELECVIPYEQQAESLSECERDRYFDILEHCDRERMLKRHYDEGSMARCEEYMIKYGEYTLSYFSTTGTRKSRVIEMIRSLGKKLITM